MNNPVELPKDVDSCHEMIQTLMIVVEELKGKLKLANHKLYGQSSEQLKFLELEIQAKIEEIKKSKGKIQLDLFTDLLASLDQATQKSDEETATIIDKEKQADSTEEATTEKKKYKTSLSNIEHLPKEMCHHGEGIKECPSCQGCNLAEYAPEITKEIEIIPAQLIIKEHHTHKFICNDCHTITRGNKPLSPIPKCMAGPDLLAHIASSRFDYYMTYYRLNREFKNYGFDISEANLCNWMGAISEDIFYRLYLEIKKDVLSGKVVYCDETVMQELAKGGCKIKYIWGYTSPHTKNMVFDYSSRHRDNPSNFLKDFINGFLVTDKYAGYDEICKKNNLTRAYCWLHARRKFHEILKICDDPNSLPDIKQIIEKIDEMLHVDKQIREGPHDDILISREKEVRPLIENIFEKVEVMTKLDQLLPKSIQKASDYLLKHTEEFRTFLKHPLIQPTNNISERNIRFITIGRKNWMFAGSDRGGKTTAIISSIVASARAHNLNVKQYLSHIIKTLPNAKISEVIRYLPQNCTQFKSIPEEELHTQYI